MNRSVAKWVMGASTAATALFLLYAALNSASPTYDTKPSPARQSSSSSPSPSPSSLPNNPAYPPLLSTPRPVSAEALKPVHNKPPSESIDVFLVNPGGKSSSEGFTVLEARVGGGFGSYGITLGLYEVLPVRSGARLFPQPVYPPESFYSSESAPYLYYVEPGQLRPGGYFAVATSVRKELGRAGEPMDAIRYFEVASPGKSSLLPQVSESGGFVLDATAKGITLFSTRQIPKLNVARLAVSTETGVFMDTVLFLDRHTVDMEKIGAYRRVEVLVDNLFLARNSP